MHSDFSLLDTACSGASSHQVQEFAPPVGADAILSIDGFRKRTQTEAVGDFRHEIPPHVADEELQALLALMARSPLPVVDLAGGVQDESDPTVIKIPLSNAPGLFALIDAEDYPLVRRYRWRVQADWQYAVASGGLGGNSIRLHRLILMVGPSKHVDHKSGATLDNRKMNLRSCTRQENMRNQRKPSNNTSGIKGVSRCGERFAGVVGCDNKTFRAFFDTLEEAAKWVRAKREELHGEFARHE